MDDDDFFASENLTADKDHKDSGLGHGDGDDALDYLIYEEITKEAGRDLKKKPGCLSLFVMFLVPLGILVLWKTL